MFILKLSIRELFLKACEQCGTEFDDELESCPKCEIKKRRRKQSLGLLIILLITGIPAMSFFRMLF